MGKDFRIYRANKTNTGNAISFQLSYKENNKYDPFMVFMTAAKQTGVDDNGNARFDWDGGIVCKLGENDLGEILSVLERRKDSVGFKGSLFHETPGGGNKVIKFNRGESGYQLNVSAQTKDKEKVPGVMCVISDAEASLLTVLLKAAIERVYGW